jgi:DNA polymerase III epsilon subunit-like protein
MDCETGGLDEETSDVLTLYMAVCTYDWKIVDELDLKLKPDGGRFPIAEAGALKVNGIDLQKHLADPNTITYSEAKVKILEFLKKYRKPGRWSNLTPLGHNCPFDLRYIWKYVVPKAEWNKLVHYGIADTKSDCDALKRWGFLPQSCGTLGSLVEHFNIPQRAAHNAKEDTLMCVDVAKAMQTFMMSKKEGGGTQDLIALLEAE